MSSSRHLGVAVISSLLFGCAGDPPELTEMVVVVEPGAQVRTTADRLEVAIATGSDPTLVTPGPTQTFMRPAWPISLTLLATQPKATLSLVVTAYQGVTPLVTRSVLTQFLPERSLLLGVTLDDACIDDPLLCASYTGMTCDAVAGAATCISSSVDARSLPDYEGQRYDAGLPAALDAGHDAGPSDAAVAGDAGL